MANHIYLSSFIFGFIFLLAFSSSSSSSPSLPPIPTFSEFVYKVIGEPFLYNPQSSVVVLDAEQRYAPQYKYQRRRVYQTGKYLNRIGKSKISVEGVPKLYDVEDFQSQYNQRTNSIL